MPTNLHARLLQLVPQPRRRFWRRYLDQAERPPACLALLGPLVVVYEIARLAWPAGGGLLAPELIRSLLAWFGLSGTWLPALALVVTLVVMQARSGLAWRLRASTPLLMLVEGLVLALPLLTLDRLLIAGAAGSGLIRAIGAGIYEELLFRLYLLTGMLWLFRDMLRAQRGAVTAAVLGSAAIFAMCHFAPLGRAGFALGPFVEYLLAGAYLGMLYRWRGIGIAAACHILYDAIIGMVKA